MGKYNYTKRVELFWDIDEVERDVFIAVSSLEKEFYLILNLEIILKKIKKNHSNLNEQTSKIYCEIYRGAFRKEVSLGTLNEAFSDSFSNNNFQVDDRISRNLDEIDANRVSFRIIVTNKNNQILASSNSIKPFFIGKKEEIKKIKKNREHPLFATKISDEIQHPWDVGFENDSDKAKMIPVIYFNSKLDIASECETDDRLTVVIFSFAFKELLRRCLIMNDVEDNKYIQEFLKFAEEANSNFKVEEIQQQLASSSESDEIYSPDIELFINNAVEKYLEQFQLLKKYENARQNLNIQSEE
jgi:hypothetical protein